MILLLLFTAGYILGADPSSLPHAPTINLESMPKTIPQKKVPGPVFLDARGPFDFALGHLAQAISIRWQDFSQTEVPHKGALDPDLDLLARKLRFLGIDPSRDVIVIGQGGKGHGEEGRVGWMLEYLGISHVKLQNIDNVPGRRVADSLAENESVPPWNPKPKDTLRIKKSDLEKALRERPTDIALIDVRAIKKKQIAGAKTIPWTSFLNSFGEPRSSEEIRKILKEGGVNIDKTLIFYSENGVASGYVTFVCAKADLHATNYDGGFDEWSYGSPTP